MAWRSHDGEVLGQLRFPQVFRTTHCGHTSQSRCARQLPSRGALCGAFPQAFCKSPLRYGRPMAAPTVRWRFVGVDLLIDPSAQRPGRGGGMRACRPTVRCTQKNRLAKSKSDLFVLKYCPARGGTRCSLPYLYEKSDLPVASRFSSVGVTYLPVQSPAKYCRRR